MPLTADELKRAPHRRLWRRLTRRVPALATSTRRVAFMAVACIALSYQAYLWLWLTGGLGRQHEADFFRIVFLIGSFPVMLGAALPMLITGQEPPASVYQGARRAGMPPLTRFGSLAWVVSWLSLLFGRPDIAVTSSLIGHVERGFVGLAEKQPRGFRRALLELPWRIAYLMNQPLIYPWLLLGGWLLSQMDRPGVLERIRTLPARAPYIDDLEERAGRSGNRFVLASRLVQLGESRRAQAVLLDEPPDLRSIAAEQMAMEDLVAIQEERFSDVISRHAGANDLKRSERAWLARAYVLSGNPQEALRLAADASARRDPRNRETAALAYEALGDKTQAIDELEAAYVMGGVSGSRLLGMLGHRLLDIGDAVEARVVLTRSVLSADFLDSAVVEDLALALERLGRTGEAEAVREALRARQV